MSYASEAHYCQNCGTLMRTYVARHWDGGLNADFGFGKLTGKLTASPVRYGIPEVCMFGNGVDLNGLHQFYAAGHGLALCSYWPGSFMYDFAAHIKKLVQIRSSYKDALIHGARINQPSTDNASLVTYKFQGTTQFKGFSFFQPFVKVLACCSQIFK